MHSNSEMKLPHQNLALSEVSPEHQYNEAVPKAVQELINRNQNQAKSEQQVMTNCHKEITAPLKLKLSHRLRR